jgi:AraC-like DNA-binding protein
VIVGVQIDTKFALMGPQAKDVTHIYHRLFDQFRIIDSEDASKSDDLASAARWLELPGCLFQGNDVILDGSKRAEGVIRPGLFVSVVLQGSARSGPRRGTKGFRYSENTVVVMALRRPVPGPGHAPGGARMFAAGLAFPMSSIDRLGLQQEFLELFSEEGTDEFVLALKAPPRILAMATEMLAPTLKGRAEELLLSAHAMEILARVIAIAGQRARMVVSDDHKQRRLRAVRDAMDKDLRRPWKISELARQAGISRRSFNTYFRRAFGMSASQYLRVRRLEAARDALLHQGVSVNDAAYLAGYNNPANFATAFRRRFGYAPSRDRTRQD